MNSIFLNFKIFIFLKQFLNFNFNFMNNILFCWFKKFNIYKNCLYCIKKKYNAFLWFLYQTTTKKKNSQKTLLLLIFNTNCFPYFFNYAAFPYLDLTWFFNSLVFSVKTTRQYVPVQYSNFEIFIGDV